MASYRARATGNWSNVNTWSIWSGSAWVNASVVPSSADDVWANSFTVTIDQNVTVLTVRNNSSGAPGTGTVSNGGFQIITGGLTLTCSTNIVHTHLSTANLITVNTTSGITTLNVTSIWSTSTGATGRVITIAGTSVANIVGNFRCGPQGASNSGCQTTGTPTVNLVGNIELIPYIGTVYTWTLSAGTTFNVTGNVLATNTVSLACEALRILGNGCNVTINGNVTWLTASNENNTNTASLINFQGFTGNLTINGSVGGGTVPSGHNAVVASGALTLIHNGVCQAGVPGTAGNGNPAIIVSSQLSISILSGPFIFGSYGCAPFSCARMFLSSNTSNYIEFASNSTNGALFPSPAPTRLTMYSPNTLADTPAASNVRQGVVYALGSQTGTLIVPSPANVALNVPTDNTVGTAVLTPASVKAAVWDALLTDITTPDTIGVRLKNASTVDSTGDQIAALINT